MYLLILTASSFCSCSSYSQTSKRAIKLKNRKYSLLPTGIPRTWKQGMYLIPITACAWLQPMELLQKRTEEKCHHSSVAFCMKKLLVQAEALFGLFWLFITSVEAQDASACMWLPARPTRDWHANHKHLLLLNAKLHIQNMRKEFSILVDTFLYCDGF